MMAGRTGTRGGAPSLSLAVAVVVILAGCAAGPTDSASTVTVFAAASLTDAFEELAAAFEQARPGSDVVLNLAGTQTLAAQLSEGAPADVFAAADSRHMAAVEERGLIEGQPRTFAGNRLAIAVEPGNPLGISGLSDLADPDLVVVLPEAEVPAGAYARDALSRAGIEVTPASLEPDVRAAQAKVSLGEADAAIVYTSDVAAADGRVTGVAIPDDVNVDATYPIAVVAGAPNREAAASFWAFVLGDEGREILADHGFTTP